MKKSLLGFIIAFIALAAIAGVVVTTNNSRQTAPNSVSDQSALPTRATDQETAQTQIDDSSKVSQASNVNIENFAFNPSKITIKKGTTVTWTNKDSTRHDITPDNPSDAFRGSKLLDQNESYSFKFDQLGTYTYICSPHPSMKGTIIVTD
jgi:plastocyanin